MEPIALLSYTLSGSALAIAAAYVYNVVTRSGSRREQELREQLAALAGRLEKCELEKEKQASVIADLELERKKLETKLEEERRRLKAEKEKALMELEKKMRMKFAEERARLLEDCEKRVEQVARVSRSAATLFDAVKNGKIRLVATEKTCEGIIIEPERILCKRDGTLEAIWPEEYSVGEALVIESLGGEE
ncbi:MAG TPA: hypothetical protein EYP33_07395 [Pyrodictium sp.]|nr:hypothetical protein [Pyrodictium sp.]